MDEHIYMHLQPTRVVMISTQCDCNSLLLVMQFATRWSHINTVPSFMANRLWVMGGKGKQFASGVAQETHCTSQ